jgi:hypothetical protein
MKNAMSFLSLGVSVLFLLADVSLVVARVPFLLFSWYRPTKTKDVILSSRTFIITPSDSVTYIGDESGDESDDKNTPVFL